MTPIAPRFHLRADEIEIDFTRSRGPGGQNVNKVETTVVLRFDAAHSRSLPGPVAKRLLRLAGRKAGRDGVITLRARKHRTQEANRRLALRMLEDLVRRAAVEPKARRKTSPTAASRRRRVETKRRQSRLKKLRARPAPGDD